MKDQQSQEVRKAINFLDQVCDQASINRQSSKVSEMTTTTKIGAKVGGNMKEAPPSNRLKEETPTRTPFRPVDVQIEDVQSSLRKLQSFQHQQTAVLKNAKHIQVGPQNSFQHQMTMGSNKTKYAGKIIEQYLPKKYPNKPILSKYQRSNISGFSGYDDGTQEGIVNLSNIVRKNKSLYAKQDTRQTFIRDKTDSVIEYENQLTRQLLENSEGLDGGDSKDPFNEHVGSGTHLSKYIKDQPSQPADKILPIQLSVSTKMLKMSQHVAAERTPDQVDPSNKMSELFASNQTPDNTADGPDREEIMIAEVAYPTRQIIGKSQLLLNDSHLNRTAPAPHEDAIIKGQSAPISVNKMAGAQPSEGAGTSCPDEANIAVETSIAQDTSPTLKSGAGAPGMMNAQGLNVSLGGNTTQLTAHRGEEEEKKELSPIAPQGLPGLKMQMVSQQNQRMLSGTELESINEKIESFRDHQPDYPEDPDPDLPEADEHGGQDVIVDIEEDSSLIKLVQLNKLGMECLSQSRFDRAFTHLKKAEKMLGEVNVPEDIHAEDHSQLFSLTMNNLGCYYKKVKKPNVALRYMKMALANEIEKGQPRSHTSSTKLNICAILSTLKKHDQAIEYAQSAIHDLAFTLKVVKIKQVEGEEEQRKLLEEQGLSASDLQIPETNTQALSQTLGIAHYNLAVEYEHANDLKRAEKTYQIALEFACQCENTEHLIDQIEDSLGVISKKLNSMKSFGKERQKLREIRKTSNFFNDTTHLKSMMTTQNERDLFKSKQEQKRLTHHQNKKKVGSKRSSAAHSNPRQSDYASSLSKTQNLMFFNNAFATSYGRLQDHEKMQSLKDSYYNQALAVGPPITSSKPASGNWSKQSRMHSKLSSYAPTGQAPFSPGAYSQQANYPAGGNRFRKQSDLMAYSKSQMNQRPTDLHLNSRSGKSLLSGQGTAQPRGGTKMEPTYDQENQLQFSPFQNENSQPQLPGAEDPPSLMPPAEEAAGGLAKHNENYDTEPNLLSGFKPVEAVAQFKPGEIFNEHTFSNEQLLAERPPAPDSRNSKAVQTAPAETFFSNGEIMNNQSNVQSQKLQVNPGVIEQAEADLQAIKNQHDRKQLQSQGAQRRMPGGFRNQKFNQNTKVSSIQQEQAVGVFSGGDPSNDYSSQLHAEVPNKNDALQYFSQINRKSAGTRRQLPNRFDLTYDFKQMTRQMTYEKPEKAPRRKIQFGQPTASAYMCPSKKIHKILTPVRANPRSNKSSRQGSQPRESIDSNPDARLLHGRGDHLDEMSEIQKLTSTEKARGIGAMSAALGPENLGDHVMALSQNPDQTRLFRTTYFYDRLGNLHEKREAESSITHKGFTSQRPFYQSKKSTSRSPAKHSKSQHVSPYQTFYSQNQPTTKNVMVPNLAAKKSDLGGEIAAAGDLRGNDLEGILTPKDPAAEEENDYQGQNPGELLVNQSSERTFATNNLTHNLSRQPPNMYMQTASNLNQAIAGLHNDLSGNYTPRDHGRRITSHERSLSKSKLSQLGHVNRLNEITKNYSQHQLIRRNKSKQRMFLDSSGPFGGGLLVTGVSGGVSNPAPASSFGKHSTSQAVLKGVDLAKLQEGPLPAQIMIGNINGNVSINFNSTTLPPTQLSAATQQIIFQQQQQEFNSDLQVPGAEQQQPQVSKQRDPQPALDEISVPCSLPGTINTFLPGDLCPRGGNISKYKDCKSLADFQTQVSKSSSSTRPKSNVQSRLAQYKNQFKSRRPFLNSRSQHQF